MPHVAPEKRFALLFGQPLLPAAVEKRFALLNNNMPLPGTPGSIFYLPGKFHVR
jgi:hypothetical protein